MEWQELRLDTSGRRILDVTADVTAFGEGRGDGLLTVFAPHATAGLALIETKSGSEADLEAFVERLLPRDDRYRHRHGSPGHGADHLLPAILSPSLTIPVIEGRLLLGVWQSVVFVDFNPDNAERRLHLTFLAG